jgi:hypothetical protein
VEHDSAEKQRITAATVDFRGAAESLFIDEGSTALDVLVTGSGLASHTAGRYQASGVRVVRA